LTFALTLEEFTDKMRFLSPNQQHQSTECATNEQQAAAAMTATGRITAATY